MTPDEFAFRMSMLNERLQLSVDGALVSASDRLGRLRDSSAVEGAREHLQNLSEALRRLADRNPIAGKIKTGVANALIFLGSKFQPLLAELSRNSLLACGVGVFLGLVTGHVLFARYHCPLKPRSMRGVAWRKKTFSDRIGEEGDSPQKLLELCLVDDLPLPRVANTDEVLVRVTAVSLDPFADVATSSPPKVGALTVGRDFVGVVEEVGLAVAHLAVGDKVWSVRNLTQPGCLQQYVVLKGSDVFGSPLGVEDNGAAAVAFSGLCVVECLNQRCRPLSDPTMAAMQNVLVVDAVSAYGSIALQILMARGLSVTAVVPRRAAPIAKLLGVDQESLIAADSLKELEDALRHSPPFAITLLGGASLGSVQILRDFCQRYSSAVECLFPYRELENASLFSHTKKALGTQLDLRGLEELREMVEMGQLTPVLDRTFPDATEINQIMRHVGNPLAAVGKSVVLMR